METGAQGKEALISAGAAVTPGVPGHPCGDRCSCDAWTPGGRLWRVVSLFRHSQQSNMNALHTRNETNPNLCQQMVA